MPLVSIKNQPENKKQENQKSSEGIRDISSPITENMGRVSENNATSLTNMSPSLHR